MIAAYTQWHLDRGLKSLGDRGRGVDAALARWGDEPRPGAVSASSAEPAFGAPVARATPA